MFSAPLSIHSFSAKITGQHFIRQATPGHAANRFHKPLNIIVFPIVEPKRLFIKTPEQMEWFNADICSLKAAFKQAPKILQSVCVDVAPFFALAISHIPISHLSKLMGLSSMMVPTLNENCRRFGQSSHVHTLRLVVNDTWAEPQRGHFTPPGHRRSATGSG